MVGKDGHKHEIKIDERILKKLLANDSHSSSSR
jgi:hypothetical protein